MTAESSLDSTRRALGFRGYVWMRWAAILGQTIAIVGALVIYDLLLPIAPLAAIVGIAAASNVGLTAWTARREDVGTEGHLFALMILDVLLLTGLLYFSGGPQNPFNFLYLVHITLGAVVLRPWQSWAIAGSSAALFGGLFFASVPLRGQGMAGSVDHSHHMELHLRGMWVAFAVAALFIVVFVQRLRESLAERERELERVRTAARSSQRLASLATLAAGAAHELATPLGTIAVAARELERELEASGAGEDAREDARTIRSEVQRCRGVLDRLAADAGEPLADQAEEIGVRALIERAIAPLERRARVEVVGGLEDVTLRVYPGPVASALRNLIENALDATPSDGSVVVEASRGERSVTIAVVDHGRGMTSDVLERVGEPFYTTKGAERGMGLGVFVARTVAKRVGGDLTLESRPGEGTRAAIRLPLNLPRP